MLIDQEIRTIKSMLKRVLDIPVNAWISERATLEAFPFSKDMLTRLRASGKLEFGKHWKHLNGETKSWKGERVPRGRSSSVIYNKIELTNYLDNL